MSQPSPASRLVILAGLAVAVVASAGFLLTRFNPGPIAKAQQPPAATEEASKELKDHAGKFLASWKGQKPDLVIVFSGQQHNYGGPCGCTSPQYGGLERRFNLINALRSFGLPVTAFDLGDIYEYRF